MAYPLKTSCTQTIYFAARDAKPNVQILQNRVDDRQRERDAAQYELEKAEEALARAKALAGILQPFIDATGADTPSS